jgi:hypothetical protein
MTINVTLSLVAIATILDLARAVRDGKRLPDSVRSLAHQRPTVSTDAMDVLAAALRGKPQQGATRVVSFPSEDIAAHVREWCGAMAKLLRTEAADAKKEPPPTMAELETAADAITEALRGGDGRAL